MSVNSPPSELDEVLAAILLEAEAGAAIDPGAWTARYPAWAAPIEDFCADLGHFGKLLGLAGPVSEATTVFHCGEDTTPQATPRSTPLVGEYELLEELGRGGMGIVYRARRVGTELEVALKIFTPDRMAGLDGLDQLRAEVNSACRLKHPHIVPIYHFGETEGRPYYTMERIEGRPLAECMARYPHDLPAAVRLLAKVARAVHHAHQRQIVHRDLKPGNILLDAQGEPHVVDFGLAVPLSASGMRTGAVIPGGSLPWMAPEAVRGERELTTAVDIWALGVILYELVAGHRPFQGNAREVQQQILTGTPPPPCLPGQRPDRDLEAICRACLQRDPTQRYGSAEALADDLDRWLSRRFPRARGRVGTVERCLRWARQHPGAVAAPLLIGTFLLVVLFASLDVLREQVEHTVHDATHTNRLAAVHVGATVLGQLGRLADAVLDTSVQPQLLALRQDVPALRRFLEQKRSEHNLVLRKKLLPAGSDGPLISMILLNTDGRYLAESPPNPRWHEADFRTRRFLGRDYFHVAMQRGKAVGRARVHVSRIFLSANDGLYKLALSVPVCPPGSSDPVGVLITTIAADPTWGLEHLHDSNHMVVLLGPEDLNDPQQVPPPSGPLPPYRIVLHPAYGHGEIPAVLPASAPLTQHLMGLRVSADGELDLPARGSKGHAEAHYYDPVAEKNPAYAGRWLAGFAPVGNSELVVGVLQRHADVVAPRYDFLRVLLAWGGGALAAILVLLGALTWLQRRLLPGR